MAQQLWVKTATKVQGPFTPAQLRRLAASGKLHRDHQVSANQEKWALAESVKGLAFPDESEEIVPLELVSPPDSISSTGEHWEDTPALEAEGLPEYDSQLTELGDSLGAADEYRLADLEEVDDPWADALPDTPAAGPPSLPQSDTSVYSSPGPVAGLASVNVLDKQKGAAIGATAIIGTLLGGCIVGGILIGALGENNDAVAGVIGILMLLFWCGGIGAGVCAIAGTGATVSIWDEGPDILGVSVRKRIAFIPKGEVKTFAHATSSMLVVRATSVGGGSSKGTIDAIWIIIIICLCMAGAIPGLIFWFAWLSARNQAEGSVNSKVTLELCGGPRLKAVPLVSVTSKDFTSMRLGGPPAIEKVIKLFTSRMAIRVLDG